jgi:hypothetical protein
VWPWNKKIFWPGVVSSRKVLDIRQQQLNWSGHCTTIFVTASLRSSHIPGSHFVTLKTIYREAVTTRTALNIMTLRPQVWFSEKKPVITITTFWNITPCRHQLFGMYAKDACIKFFRYVVNFYQTIRYHIAENKPILDALGVVRFLCRVSWWLFTEVLVQLSVCLSRVKQSRNVGKHEPTRRKNLEERRHQLHRSGNLKSRANRFLIQPCRTG